MWWWNFSWTYGSFFVGFYVCLVPHTCEQWPKPWLFDVRIHIQGIALPITVYRDWNKPLYGSLSTRQYNGMSAKGFVAVAHVVISYASPLRWDFNSTLVRYSTKNALILAQAPFLYVYLHVMAPWLWLKPNLWNPPKMDPTNWHHYFEP